MPHCSVCLHPKITDIDKRLCNGEPASSIAATFDLAAKNVGNHFREHLAEKLKEIYKQRKLRPLAEYLDMLRARGETVLRQAIPCQELDGVDHPDAEPVPLIDFEKHSLTEIGNLFKSQVLLNELIGRATGELLDSCNAPTSGVKLSIMLPGKVEPGERASELMEYRRRVDEQCTSIVDVTHERLLESNQQLTLELD